MLLLSFFNWWFTDGWFRQFEKVYDRSLNVARMFSMGTLLETMFAPWKQIISTTGPDNAINMKFRAMLDNLVSRFIGFWIRFFSLLAGITLLIIVFLGSIALAIIWPILPVSPIVFGLITMGSL